MDINNRKGGTRKIRDITPEERCRHPDHDPAGSIVLSPGDYEHECPSCGKKQYFHVPLITC